jgi:hypothetical protein
VVLPFQILVLLTLPPKPGWGVFRLCTLLAVDFLMGIGGWYMRKQENDIRKRIEELQRQRDGQYKRNV